MANHVFPSLCSYLDKTTQQLSIESELLLFIPRFITSQGIYRFNHVWGLHMCVFRFTHARLEVNRGNLLPSIIL